MDLINEDTGVVVATSSSGDITVGNDPNELVQFTTAEPQASYCLRVSLKTPSDTLLSFNLQSYHRHELEHATPFRSITSPAEITNPGMPAVGAAPWDNTSEIRPFSRRGPMNDGTTKPDIVAADGTYSAVLGRTWQGTDLASARVAGLAALVKQRYPNYTPE